MHEKSIQMAAMVSELISKEERNKRLIQCKCASDTSIIIAMYLYEHQAQFCLAILFLKLN
jgi:hypothetical protein